MRLRGLLLALLLAALAPTTSLQTCSSLLGSQCHFVNQLDPPRYVRGLSSLPDPEDARIELNKMLHFIRSLPRGKLNVTGSFRVVAALQEDLRFAISPVEWVSKPGPSWHMVGISGALKRPDDELVGTISDPQNEGKSMNGCSPIHLKRAGNGLPELKPSLVTKLEGRWEGAYTCHGAKTVCSLTLARSSFPATASGARRQAGPSGVAKLSGLFQFHAVRD